MPVRMVMLLVGLLIALQPLATDLYLPALPTLGRVFSAPAELVQLTVSVFMISYGVGQLLWGPVADARGRKPVLLTGLLLYAASMFVGMASSSLYLLIAYRAIQGFGLAAILVCARAIIRDLFQPAEGALVAAGAMSWLAVIATLSPILGGVLTDSAGWRASLGVTALVAAVLLVVCAWRVPETLELDRRKSFQAHKLPAVYWMVFRNPTFLGWALLSACGYATNVGFYSTSSYIYINHFSVSPALFGLVLGSGSFAFFVGTLVCRRRLLHLGVAGALRFASRLSLLSVAAFLLPSLMGGHSALTLAIALWLNMFAYGFYQPCGNVGITAAFPNNAGAAAALGGFVITAGAFVGAALGAFVHDGTPMPIATMSAMFILCSASMAMFYKPIQR